MLEATLTRRKGRPNGGTVYGRLLHFLEGVIGWKEARNPSLSKTAGHPTVWLHRAASVGRRRAEAPLPVYSESVFANIFCFQFQEELWENLWIKPNAKCWTLFPFLSDCFNCSVVVLMDLRPWRGSCLSDFQLLFVNNLKRKKKKNLYILETNLCEFFIGTNVVFNTRGFVQFFAFSTRKQCKVISQCEEKKNCHYDQTHSLFCSNHGIQSTQSRDSAVETLFLYLVWAFPFFPVLICKRKCLFCVNLCCTM